MTLNQSRTIMTPRRRSWLLFSTLLAAMVGSTNGSGFAYLIPSLHVREHLSLATAGTLTALIAIGAIITGLAWGYVMDQYGERLCLTLSLSLNGVFMALLPWALACQASWSVIGLLLFLSGAAGTALNSAGARLVSGWYPAEHRGKALALRQTAQPLGVAFCAVFIVQIVHNHPSYWGYFPMLALTIVTLIFTRIFVFNSPPKPTVIHTTGNITENPYREGRHLFLIHLTGALLNIPQILLWSWMPTWLQLDHHFTANAVTVLIVISQFLSAGARVFFGGLSDSRQNRLGLVRLIAGASACSLTVLAVTDYFHNPIVYVAAVITSVAVVADNSLLATSITEYAGQRWGGRAVSVHNMLMQTTSIVANYGFGRFIEFAGFPASYLLAAVTPFTALFFIPNDRPSPFSLPAEPAAKPQPTKESGVNPNLCES